MKFEHPHSLGKEEAKRRIERLSSHWQARYGVAVAWFGDSARLTGAAKGIAFDATLTVADTHVAAEGTDPGILMRALVTGYFKRKLTDYLNPSKSIDDLENP